MHPIYKYPLSIRTYVKILQKSFIFCPLGIVIGRFDCSNNTQIQIITAKKSSNSDLSLQFIGFIYINTID